MVPELSRPFLEASRDAELGSSRSAELGSSRTEISPSRASPPSARVPSSGSSFFSMKAPSMPHGASILSSVLNLLNTCMGTGVLALPDALATAGYASGCALCLLFALFNMFTLHLIDLSSTTLAKRQRDSPTPVAPSFYSICEAAFPRAGLLVDVAVVINCLGSMVSYLIVAGDSFTSFAAALLLPPALSDRRAWILLSIAAVGPICFLRRMDGMRVISLLGVSSLLVIAGATPVCSASTRAQVKRWIRFCCAFVPSCDSDNHMRPCLRSSFRAAPPVSAPTL